MPSPASPGASPPSASPAGDLVGQVIEDRYRIIRVLGRGGMGVVYEAEAVRLGRSCAVKVLLPEFTSNKVATERFRREAQVAARVKHSNVVEIFDTGTISDGRGYIAMELLEGESLDRTLRREVCLPWPRARHIILQVCRALGAAHARGVVHRDVKPENCFRTSQDGDDDIIKVLDFGIAKLTAPEASEAAQRLTATASVIGTYAYMAYEQIAGQDVDARADVWAVGVMLYEMLTGRLPFIGQNQGQMWMAIAQYEPAAMRNIAPDTGIPEAVEVIVQQALAKQRDDRFPSMEALAQAVSAVPDGAITVAPLSNRSVVEARREPPPLTASAAHAATAHADIVFPVNAHRATAHAATAQAKVHTTHSRAAHAATAASPVPQPSLRPNHRTDPVSPSAATQFGLGAAATGEGPLIRGETRVTAVGDLVAALEPPVVAPRRAITWALGLAAAAATGGLALYLGLPTQSSDPPPELPIVLPESEPVAAAPQASEPSLVSAAPGSALAPPEVLPGSIPPTEVPALKEPASVSKASSKRTSRTVSLSPKEGFERVWSTVQTCLCEVYQGFPPSIKIRISADARSGKLSAVGTNISDARAQDCLVKAMAKAPRLPTPLEGTGSEELTRRPVCQ